MLLAVDIGNSNISIGLFDREGALRFLASLDTDRRKTADQICVDLMNLFQLYHYRYQDISDSILCSVVPPLNFMTEKALTRLLGKPPMVVGPGVKTGLNIRLAVQTQMGADIVADAVAALESFTELIVSVPAYLSANDGSMAVWSATLATVRLSVMPTLVVVFTAPTVLVTEPDITKPPERLAAADTSAKVPL